MQPVKWGGIRPAAAQWQYGHHEGYASSLADVMFVGCLAKSSNSNSNRCLLAKPGVIEAKIPQRLALEGTMRWDTRPDQASLLRHQG